MVLVPVEDIVERAMVKLSVDYPIFTSLIIRIGYKVVDNKAIKACAWTDGTSIYINKTGIDYYNSDPIKNINGQDVDCTITRDHMIFILCHELMHLIGQTFPRGLAIGIPRYGYNDRDKAKNQLWNMATDYEINSLLQNNESDGHYQPIGILPPFALYENKYKEMVAEKIYEDLAGNQDNQGQGQGQGQDQNGSNNNQSPSKSGGSGGNNSSFSDPTKNNQGDGDGDGKGLDFGLDLHMPIADDTVQNEVTQKIGEVLGGVVAGTGCSAIDREIDRGFKQQPFNWRKALTKYIRGWIRDSYTWNKPSRAGIANKLILPSTSVKPKIHIACAIDTSGSVGDPELKTMLNHLFTILTQFNTYTLDLWCCSTQVHENTFTTFTQANRNSLVDIRIESDGGTDLRKNFEFLEKKYVHKKPDVFILLSDFQDSMSGDTELTCNIPCVWMVLDNKSFVPPAKIKAQVFPFDVNA